MRYYWYIYIFINYITLTITVSLYTYIYIHIYLYVYIYIYIYIYHVWYLWYISITTSRPVLSRTSLEPWARAWRFTKPPRRLRPFRRPAQGPPPEVRCGWGRLATAGGGERPKSMGKMGKTWGKWGFNVVLMRNHIGWTGSRMLSSTNSAWWEKHGEYVL